MFFLESWLIAMIIAPAAGTFGCFLAWRRIAFFADALTHASVLGMAISFIIQINLTVGIACVGLVVFFVLWVMRSRREMPADSLLSLIGHSFLGAGIIIIGIADIQIDLLSYILGEWLVVSYDEVMLTGIVVGLIMLTLWFFRWQIISSSVNPEIAAVEAGGDWKGTFILFFALVLFISVSVQIVGLILLNSIMIMPALIARHWAKNPYAMIGCGIVAALLMISLGLGISLNLNLPASPTAAVCGGILFLLSLLAKQLLRRSVG